MKAWLKVVVPADAEEKMNLKLEIKLLRFGNRVGLKRELLQFKMLLKFEMHNWFQFVKTGNLEERFVLILWS